MIITRIEIANLRKLGEASQMMVHLCVVAEYRDKFFICRRTNVA